MRIEATAIPPEFDRYYDPAYVLEACHDRPLDGYPPPASRWHITEAEWDEMAATGVITVPDDERWAVWRHPLRDEYIASGGSVDPANPDEIDPAQKQAWRNEYPLVTHQGLPVHPKARLGVTTEILDKHGNLHKLGMATGIGRERRYGALKTGALLVARLGASGNIEYPVVTEQRGSRLRRSFPGGYVELGEEIADACVREGAEETGIVAACAKAGIPWSDIEKLPHILWALSPSVTGPCTINAWLAEHFLAFNATAVPEMLGVTLRIGERAIKTSQWLSACELVQGKTLLGAHRRALRAHLGAMGVQC